MLKVKYLFKSLEICSSLISFIKVNIHATKFFCKTNNKERTIVSELLQQKQVKNSQKLSLEMIESKASLIIFWLNPKGWVKIFAPILK